MFFSSIKGLNRLMNKGMSNIHLKVTIGKNCCFSNFRFFIFKNFVSRAVFGGLQLTQILWNFKTSCCDLKTKVLEAKVCVVFCYFNLVRNWVFLKSKRPCVLLNKNINSKINKTESKIENTTQNFRETNLIL